MTRRDSLRDLERDVEALESDDGGVPTTVTIRTILVGLDVDDRRPMSALRFEQRPDGEWAGEFHKHLEGES